MVNAARLGSSLSLTGILTYSSDISVNKDALFGSRLSVFNSCDIGGGISIALLVKLMDIVSVASAYVCR